MFAAVVPPKRFNWQTDAEAFVKYAVKNFKVFVAYLVPVNIVDERFLEETCWRQLLVIACDHKGFASVDGADGVFWNNL